jgi:general nucleoside transport system ATP-binding protein
MLRLELIDISKQYPAVKANDRVNLRVKPGEIHAVLGENGAGKSTMMKMIYGAVRPDEGEIRWNGQAVQIASPAQARTLGISMVYQHFSLFDTLTAAENVWLGLDKHLTLAEVTARISKVAKEYGLDVDPLRPVHTLSVGERQRVEIVRALLTNPKLLILDEPTSVLTPQAVDKLFVTLRQLASEGCSILYISHKLDEIRALCHHCTVLRGGKVTGEVDPTRESNASLSRLMIGAEPPSLQHIQAKLGATVLEVRGLSVPKADPFATALSDIGLEVRAGEIVGIAGVSGNGQQELMAALSGEDLRAPRGSIKLFGQDIAHDSPRPQGGPALRARGTPRPRGGAHAVARAEHAAHAHRHGRAQRLGPHRRRDPACAGPDQALQRQGRRAAGGGQEPVGRQPAEIHRRARDRRRSEAADRLAADLGRGRRRGRADPRRTARAARQGLCAARRQRGARRAVRDLRSPRRDRAGPGIAEHRDLEGDDRDDRRMDERPVE